MTGMWLFTLLAIKMCYFILDYNSHVLSGLVKGFLCVLLI